MDSADDASGSDRAMNAQAQPVEILLVEDDPGDVLITREAIESSKVANRLNVVSNGEEALAYLRREPPYDDAARPGLVLLDLNLPRLDGRAVLAEVKADPDLRRIPIVVLTTSSADEDIVRSYDLHANAYVTKPVDFDQFMRVVRQIDEFFVSIVTLPPV
jgi:CheY-like chemotaxis protein